MNAQARFLRIVSGDEAGPVAAAARAGLGALSPLYRAAVGARNWAYDRGWRSSKTLARPVISVGNLTAGGTGKTPVVAWLCERLHERGIRPAILLRGYKAAPGQKGDEQRLLEGLLGPGTPVEADPDRAAAAERVLARSPGVQAFVLDDGFQHRRVQRDVDLVLIDATQPFGHGRLLPRGLLREPISSLRRAYAVLITRAEPEDPRILPLRETIARRTSAPVFQCRFAVDRIVDAGGALVSVAGRPVHAVCGIGNPRSFLEKLQRAGANVRDHAIFADHHAYTPADVQRISAAARQSGALVVTTTKDWVKIRSLWPSDAAGRIAILEQRLEFQDGQETGLLNVIVPALTRPGDRPSAPA